MKRDLPGKPAPGREMMRRLTGREATATGLDRDTYIMTEIATGMVTFWQRGAGGPYEPLFSHKHHEWVAEAKLEELWKSD